MPGVQEKAVANTDWVSCNKKIKEAHNPVKFK
jgi:hypothetical protein